MVETREIKSFIHSHYFSDGLRITFGGVFPSLLLAQFGMLNAGIIISLGALTTSIADGPGPLIHKKNGMLFCILFIFITALITGFINENRFLIMAGISFFCFFYSMLNVYGSRASAIGTAAMLIMILTIDRRFTAAENIIYSLQLLIGGLWYFVLSLSISQIRPYRMAQQTLGICIDEVAEYLEIKAGFYNTRKDYDETYRKLIAQQVVVHEQQDNVREILFKTRQIIKESTKASRRILMVFVDVVDLFEQTMATDYDYQKIRADFGSTTAVRQIQKIILKIARELKNLGYYITSNAHPVPLYNFQQDLEELKSAIDKIESETGNTFVLKKILVSIRNIVGRIQKMYNYYNPKQGLIEGLNVDVSKFVSHQDYDISLLRDNLTLNSSTFRHALRVTIMMLIGYTAAGFIALGHHSYWILLTILVILKPGFSLTKQRNYQRVVGTFAGGIIGALVVMYVKDETARFIILLVFMIAAYSFQRLNYIISVLFMTPYVLIMFSFIGLGNLSVARERILDTFIGAAIAFAASYFVFPSWEQFQMKGHMKKMLIANYNYLILAAKRLKGAEVNETEYKLARKEVFVSSANLGAAFQRMLSEPKNKQRHVKEMHGFVVFNHILSSYIATLINSLQQNENRLVNTGDMKLLKKSLYRLAETAKKLDDGSSFLNEYELTIPENLLQPQQETPDTRLITEQLSFVKNVVKDIQKVTAKILEE